MNRKNRTREQRKARAALRVRVIACAVMAAAVLFCMADAAAQEETVSAADYLEEIGADNAQRAYVMALYEEWEG